MPDTDPRITGIIDAYCAVWNEPGEAARANGLRAIWAEDATYTDPSAGPLDSAELVAHIGRLQARRAGARIVRTSVVDTHHNVARFHWRLVNADGSALPEGIDFAEFAPDGRIARIVGFFGPLGGTLADTPEA